MYLKSIITTLVFTSVSFAYHPPTHHHHPTVKVKSTHCSCGPVCKCNGCTCLSMQNLGYCKYEYSLPNWTMIHGTKYYLLFSVKPGTAKTDFKHYNTYKTYAELQANALLLKNKGHTVKLFHGIRMNHRKP